MFLFEAISNFSPHGTTLLWGFQIDQNLQISRLWLSPKKKVKQVQGYYGRTRDTYIVHAIVVMLAVLAISLGRAVIFRRARRDVVAVVALLLMLPYFVLVMEPAEDACVGPKADTMSEADVRQGLFFVGVGHILLIIVGGAIALMEVDWLRVADGAGRRTSNTKKVE